MYAYIGLAYYEQDLDNEYKERTVGNMTDEELNNPYGYSLDELEKEIEAKEDYIDTIGNQQYSRLHEKGEI